MKSVVNNPNFKILILTKDYIAIQNNFLLNVPNKEMFIKDTLRYESHSLIKNIITFEINSDKETGNNIIINISLIEYYLEYLYNKKYFSKDSFELLINKLLTLHKMCSSWIKNKNEGK